MRSSPQSISRGVIGCFLLAALAAANTLAQTTEITSSPSSWTFENTYLGKASGSKVFTITNQTTSGSITIETVSFSCPGFGLSSGVAPFMMGQVQKITHYSIFFQPTTAQVYNCNFVLTLNDGTFLNVPLTGTGLASTATSSISNTSLSFANQTVGTTSAGQTVTITNNGSGSVNLQAINPSPPSFTTSAVTLPYNLKANSSLSLSVYYTPSQVTSETGALDFTYDALPDNGVSLSGNGKAASSLVVSTSPTLPQATQNAAYQAPLATSGGVGPYTWSLVSGSTLPSGLTLSTSGVISGTLASSVSIGNYTFTVQVTDTSNNSTASSLLTLGVYTNLGDNCNDISFNVPNTSTPMIALNDLGTGTYQGSEGGLYPNGSNVRPASHDSDGVAFADAIQPLDSNGNPSPTGKYVLLAVGESTAQNEFNRFLPIANSDPAKNPNLMLVNGAQGGATPNNFTSTTSAYWQMVLNNYLPQNGVTANQVVAIWMEDTDGIATGTFPTDIATLQTEYETIMQTMHTLFPNLKLVYFSSRVYGGYSNGVGTPANPEPYAFEVGFATKWAIGDQINGAANLNYNPANGPVLAPWMSWGPYYWSNGMLGRNDGLVWDCEDFSSDGTHPSTTFGQLKVSSRLLNFLKTDDTTVPWYLAANLTLTPTAGNNQSGSVGTILPTALTVLAENLNSGNPVSGVTVTFSDNGANGAFGTSSGVTGSNGTLSTTYTLPATAQTVNITAQATGYAPATFTETATSTVLALTATGGNNQSGSTGTTLPTPLTVTATNNGTPVSGVSVTFTDGGANGSFNPATAVTGSNGTASTSYTLGAVGTITVTASSSGYTPATFTETSTAPVLTLAVSGGNNQTGATGTTLPTALTVLATKNGVPVSGLSVSFTDNGASGKFNPAVAVTNSSGIASTSYTLGTVGTITITASSTGYTSATFTETSTAASVLTLSAAAGNNQTGATGTTLPIPLSVLATNNGVAVQGVTVTFTDNNAQGSFGTPSGTTNSSGTFSSTYTLPSTAKTVTITASATGYTSATFTETATTGSTVASITLVSGGKQVGTVGTTLPLPIVMKAKNSSGQGVAGASISFSDGGVGGTFTPNPAITGSTGQASTTYTLPTVPKSINVTASNGSVNAKTTEQSRVGPATALNIVSGNNQTGVHGQLLPQRLVVSVTDQYKNGIGGVTVTFADNGAGGIFSTTTPVTSSNGQASVTYTAGTKAGTVTISASISTLGPVNFTETIK